MAQSEWIGLVKKAGVDLDYLKKLSDELGFEPRFNGSLTGSDHVAHLLGVRGADKPPVTTMRTILDLEEEQVAAENGYLTEMQMITIASLELDISSREEKLAKDPAKRFKHILSQNRR